MDYKDTNTFSERLKWARAQKGWTQDVVRRKTGIPQSTLSGYERGVRSTDGEAKKLYALAKALEVNPDWLANGIGSPYMAEQEIIEYKVKEKLNDWPFRTSKEEIERLSQHFIDEIDNFIESLVRIQKNDKRFRVK